MNCFIAQGARNNSDTHAAKAHADSDSKSNRTQIFTWILLGQLGGAGFNRFIMQVYTCWSV